MKEVGVDDGSPVHEVSVSSISDGTMVRTSESDMSAPQEKWVKSDICKATIYPVWKSFNIDKRRGRSKLSYIAPRVENGLEYFVVEEEDVRAEVEYWSNSVVCYVMGFNPPYPVRAGFLCRIWWHCKIDKILLMKKRVFLVQFQDKESQECVLKGLSIQFHDKAMVVVPWKSQLTY